MVMVNDVSQSMTAAERQETLLNLSKLLLDEDRLKILGLLAQQPCSAERLTTQLAVERVKLHLHKLEEATLVQKHMEQGIELYHLDSKQIFKLKKLLFAHTESNPAQSTEEKDLAKFIKHESLVQLPVHPAKLLLVLRWLADKIPPGVDYPEKEINERLKGHTIDHVTLRRLLIDHGLLTRHAGIYQRPN
jgi:DNA-binding transcriptional ArsR family regulator